jgi:hypothetical protein
MSEQHLESGGFGRNIRRLGQRAYRPIGLLILVLLIVLVAYGPSLTWQATVAAPDGSPFVVNGRVLSDLIDLYGEEQGIPVERLLVKAGHHAVERLVATEPDGTRHEFEWAAVAANAWWQKDGRLAVGGETFRVSQLEAKAPALLGQVQASITDIAPTAAAALGLPAPAQATGQALQIPATGTRQVLLLFLDGLGYLRYDQARSDGLIPNLSALGQPLIGLSVYPPITSVASAAVLTGAPPEVNGVDRRGIRKTDVETLFDVAARGGLQAVAVEGEALPFNLRAIDVQLSGDRDGNGSTDDNVLANTLLALETTKPDLLYIHFHGIDDAEHTYGPAAPEVSDAIRQVDAAVGELIDALPADTLILAFADHGQHPVEEEGRLGNHGQLLDTDVFVPIWVAKK